MSEVRTKHSDKRSILILSGGLLFANGVFIAAYIGISRMLEDYLLAFIIALTLSASIVHLFHNAAMSAQANNNERH